MSIASAAVRMAACTATDGTVFGPEFDPEAGDRTLRVGKIQSESHARRVARIVQRFGSYFVTLDDPDAGLRFSLRYSSLRAANQAARALVR